MNEKNNFPNSQGDDQDGKMVSGGFQGENYHVVLPCEVKDFGRFVSGLLGRPQELHGEIHGDFSISHNEISNIYHLLSQRMQSQNDSTLVHFLISVHYNDGTSVTHNNVDQFESYIPISACFPVSVSVSATYLIRFRDREIPEKQISKFLLGLTQIMRERMRGVGTIMAFLNILLLILSGVGPLISRGY